MNNQTIVTNNFFNHTHNHNDVSSTGPNFANAENTSAQSSVVSPNVGSPLESIPDAGSPQSQGSRRSLTFETSSLPVQEAFSLEIEREPVDRPLEQQSPLVNRARTPNSRS